MKLYTVDGLPAVALAKAGGATASLAKAGGRACNLGGGKGNAKPLHPPSPKIQSPHPPSPKIQSPHPPSPRLRRVNLLLLLLLPLISVAQSDKELFPPKPEPAVYVHDYAGWLTPHEKTVLEEKLIRYYDSTSTQIVVMIRPDIGDYDKASYAFELGNRWGIGRKDKNNGVVLLIKTEQPGRGAFIATGYGTEGALPDITAGRIIRNTMIPYFQREQYAQGIEAGVDDIIQALSGEFKNEGEKGTPIPWWVPVLIVLLIFLFVFFMAKMAKKHGTWYTHSGTGIPRRSNRRRDDDWGGGWWMGGGGGGWGGGGGGGWGGGGGSFGGGSFGGGGAGGDW